MRLTPLFSILGLSLAVATSGCSGMGLKQTLDPQVDQVREMREQLSADWAAIGNELDAVERDLVAFGNQRIDIEDVDPALVTAAVETIEVPDEVPDEATAEDIEAAEQQVEARMAAYEQSVGQQDDEVRAKLENVRKSGAQLSQRLYVDLPALLSDVSKRASGVAVELATIQGTAGQVEAMADKNPLMTDADDRELDKEQAELDREGESLTQLAQRIAAESAAYGGRLAAATAQFNVELSSLVD